MVSGAEGKSFIDMSKVKGGYTWHGRDGSTVADGYIAYNQTGVTQSGGVFTNQTRSTHKTSSSWTITVPSSWKGVIPSDIGDVGCTYQVTLQRPSGYQWSTDELTNHISL